jgi:hypothetical protein
VFLKEKPGASLPITLGGKKAGVLVDELSGPSPPRAGTEVVVPASCLVERAILLTYDCEIDKDKRHRTIALVRPMTGLRPEEQEVIRKNGKYACFYLPALDDAQPEGYVDFRRLTTVSPDWLDKGKRIASLSEQARRKLLLRLFLFFSRLQFEETIFETTAAAEEPG